MPSRVLGITCSGRRLDGRWWADGLASGSADRARMKIVAIAPTETTPFWVPLLTVGLVVAIAFLLFAGLDYIRKQRDARGPDDSDEL